MRGMKRFASYMAIVVAFYLCVSNNTFADELTIYGSETATDAHFPVYGLYMDTPNARQQFIIPKADIADLEGATIKGLKFYSSNTTTQAWAGNVCVVKMAEVTNAECTTSFISASTTVYTGTLSVSSSQMSITLSNPFDYEGSGNLLIDITVQTKGSYKSCSFYGKKPTNNSACWSTSGSIANVVKFIPRTTFTYEAAAPVSCPKPGSLSGVATTSSSANITWQKTGSETAWNLQYSSNGGTSWTTLNLNTSNVAVSGDNCSYTLTGLSAQTTYQVKVQADCGGGDESAWTSSASFTTLCGVMSLPFEENFSSALSSCWTMTDCTSNTKVISGTFRFAYNSSPYPPQYLITPLLETSGKVVKVEFKYAIYSTNYPEKFQVGYSTTTNDVSAFTFGTETTATNLTPSYKTYSENLPSGVKYVAIKYTSKNMYYFYIDDLTIISVQDCGKPATPTCSNLTGSSVTLNWAANTGVTEYKYLYIDRTVNPSATPDWTSATNITATTVNLTGLTDGHTYDFYVMCACGDVASDAFVPSHLSLARM